MCRAVEPTCPARLSWLSPRRWRHCRSRAPNGLAWRVTGASMAAAPPYHDSLPGNRLAGGWPPTLVGMAELSTDLVVAAAEAALADIPRPAPATSDLLVCPWFRVGDQIIRTIAMVARFDHPAETTLDELRVELMYPMDDTADDFFRSRPAHADGAA